VAGIHFNSDEEPNAQIHWGFNSQNQKDVEEYIEESLVDDKRDGAVNKYFIGELSGIKIIEEY
jgi:hypothetical protein